MTTPAERLEYLRGQIHAQRIAWGEIAELQDLAHHIDPDDVELRQWAGIPEFPDDQPPTAGMTAYELIAYLSANFDDGDEVTITDLQERLAP